MHRKILVTAICLLSACAPMQRETSEVHHDPGRFLNGNNAEDWVSINDQLWLEHIAAGRPTYSSSHPMTQRMQFWADRIRENMLKSSPDLAITPRPVVRIVDKDEVNAFVSGVEVCIDVAITTNPGSTAAAKPLSFLRGATGNFATKRPEKCVTFQGNLEAKRKVIQGVYRSVPNCQVTVSGEQIVLTPSCVGKHYGEKFTGLATVLTHNYVTFFRTIFEKMTEAEVIGVMAHELGHYYMNHLRADPGLYNFLYELKNNNPDTRPVPLPADHPLAQLGRKAQAAPKVKPFQVVPGQDLHSLTYNVVSSMSSMFEYLESPAACMPGSSSCLEACASLVANMDSYYDERLSSFPEEFGDSPMEKAAYAQYEAETRTCLSGLTAASVEGDLTSAMGHYISSRPVIAPQAASGQNALQLLKEADQIVRKAVPAHQAERDTTIQQALQSGIGWYTVEQESDDIATEMVFRLGLDPMAVVTSNLVFDDIQSTGTCREKYQQGFPSIESIGNFEEIHHASCFRAYNSFKELAVHKADFEKYKENTTPVAQPIMSWESLVALLKQVY